MASINGVKSKLGAHVEILSGFAFDSALFGTEHGKPLARIRDVVRGETQTKYRGSFDDRYLIKAGDLLIGMDGDFNRAIWQSESALLNQRVCKVTANADSLDQRYLFHFLPAALMNIWTSTPFATVKHLSVKAIREIPIVLPALDEQRRIAAVLDKADELRAKRREALAHLEALTQSIFHEMFGDQRLNTMQWPTLKIGSLLTFGPQNGMYLPAKEYGAGSPIVRIGSFRGGFLDDSSTFKRLNASAQDLSTYSLAPGDVLINRVNSIEHLGKSTVIPDLTEPTVFESNMMRCRFDPRRAHPEFLRLALQSGHVYGQIVGRAKRAVNQASINQTDVKAIELRLPPLELQQTFATRVAAVERLKETHRKHLAQLDTLFSSLQHRAFNGEL